MARRRVVDYRPKKLYYDTKKSDLTKRSLIRGIEASPGILSTILGGKRRALKELQLIKPSYIKRARLKEFGYLPTFLDVDAKKRLKGLDHYGRFSYKNSGVYIKPYAPYGVLTHEIQHGIHHGTEKQAQTAGAAIRNRLGVHPTDTMSDRVHNSLRKLKSKITGKKNKFVLTTQGSGSTSKKVIKKYREAIYGDK